MQLGRLSLADWDADDPWEFRGAHGLLRRGGFGAICEGVAADITRRHLLGRRARDASGTATQSTRGKDRRHHANQQPQPQQPQQQQPQQQQQPGPESCAGGDGTGDGGSGDGGGDPRSTVHRSQPIWLGTAVRQIDSRRAAVIGGGTVGIEYGAATVPAAQSTGDDVPAMMSTGADDASSSGSSGRLEVDAAIVTVPLGVLQHAQQSQQQTQQQHSTLKFLPSLPPPHRDAIARLGVGLVAAWTS
eukprot:COSAG01_NODE_2170_length_8236_cov_17.597272_5_plen_245_part_00